jgi:hypothetical protein
LRFDGIRGPVTGIGPAAAREPANRADAHIMVANDLATQPNGAEQATSFEHIFFGDRHLVRFASDELNAAGRAAGIPAASVELIDLGLVLQSQDQPLAGGHVESSTVFHRQFRHGCVPLGGRATQFNLMGWTLRGNKTACEKE